MCATFAENNAITTIQIPQTYMSHLNKQLDKGGGGSTNKTPAAGPRSVASKQGGKGAAGEAGSVATGHSIGKSTTANKSSASSAQPSSKSKATRKTSSSGGGGDGQPSEESSSGHTSASAAPVVGLQYLNELYLCGNKIESLVGIEAYGTVSLWPPVDVLSLDVLCVVCWATFTFGSGGYHVLV